MRRVWLVIAAAVLLWSPGKAEAQCWGWLWGNMCIATGSGTLCRHCAWAMCDVTCSTAESFFYCQNIGHLFCDGAYPSSRGLILASAPVRSTVKKPDVTAPAADNAVWTGVAHAMELLSQGGDQRSADRLAAVMALSLALGHEPRPLTLAEGAQLLADLEAPLASVVKQTAGAILVEAVRTGGLPVALWPRYRDLAYRLMGDPDWAVRAKAVMLLGSLGDLGSRATLAVMAHDDNPLVAALARRVLDPKAPLPTPEEVEAQAPR